MSIALAQLSWSHLLSTLSIDRVLILPSSQSGLSTSLMLTHPILRELRKKTGSQSKKQRRERRSLVPNLKIHPNWSGTGSLSLSLSFSCLVATWMVTEVSDFYRSWFRSQPRQSPWSSSSPVSPINQISRKAFTKDSTQISLPSPKMPKDLVFSHTRPYAKESKQSLVICRDTTEESKFNSG